MSGEACLLLTHSQKALSSLTRRKADLPSTQPPSHEEMSEELGHHFATALTGKKAWLGGELLRMKREGTGEVTGSNGMELDTPMS